MNFDLIARANYTPRHLIKGFSLDIALTVFDMKKLSKRFYVFKNKTKM